MVSGEGFQIPGTLGLVVGKLGPVQIERVTPGQDWTDVQGRLFARRLGSV